jgi:hypothetical protein
VATPWFVSRQRYPVKDIIGYATSQRMNLARHSISHHDESTAKHP